MREEQIDLPLAWGTLAGTLQQPEADGPWPAVLVIAGSGPTDRDGNTPLLPERLDNLKRLAAALAQRGMASLRYDKRGVGGSRYPGLNESELRFEHLVEDAVAAAHWLQQDARFSGVLLLGHSEGALIAALAAAAVQPQGVVAVSGVADRASDVMRAQIQGKLPEPLLQAAMTALASLEAGEPAEGVPDDLVLLFRPSVQPYLISWFRHDPAAVLAAVEAPVLLVHGASDTQVPVDHARRLLAARNDARLLVVNGMDHTLTIGPDREAGVEQIAAEVQGWARELVVS